MKLLQVAALVAVGATGAQAGCVNEGGNWYCNKANKIQYTSVGKKGQYNRVASMDQGTGGCQKVPFSFGDGDNMAPWSEGMAIAVRGPINFKRFAAYEFGGKPAKRSEESAAAEEPAHVHRRHGHGHEHLHQERGFPTMWRSRNGNKKEAPPPEAAAPPPPPPPPPKPADYTRVGFYDAPSQTREGIVFLNNHGGSGSGKFTYTFGNTLSFANEDASNGAAAPTTLKDILIPSNREFLIFKDEPCDGDCDFYQPGSVAYKGFAGRDKVWLFEFQMPYDGTQGFNADMPSVWALNAKVPRTAQYNDCSCWAATGGFFGCGEIDIHEVLSPGANRGKSTFHCGVGKCGGSSDWFPRPANAPMIMGVVFDSESGSVTIKVLPSGTEFPPTLDRATVKDFMSDSHTDGLSSLFAMVN